MKYFFTTLLFVISISTFGQLENVRSLLEVYDVDTGLRETIYQEDTHFEAPNWSPNNDFFVVNGGGLLYRILLDGSKKELIYTDFADKCNNDHGISPDGQSLVISHYDQLKVPYADRDFRSSTIYTVPIMGGTPKKITQKAPSFWHGWSPDGKELAYTALRSGGEFDIYTIPVDGGTEIRLTASPGLDDGPDYSHDGQYIYYNSMQSGNMQIWRMDRDGGNKVQLTFDEYSNWFPHPSPDGKHFVFLSYLDNQGDKHPAMQKVALRLYDLETNGIKELFRFIGGQGTINVPSWSPDGKKFAFVSYEHIGKSDQTLFDADKIFLLTDGDMPATAYIDGKVQGKGKSKDVLQVFHMEKNGLQEVASMDVSNSVRRWPNSMSMNTNGTHLLIAEQDGQAPLNASNINEIPKASKLSLVNLTGTHTVPKLVDEAFFEAIPTSVGFHPHKNLFALTLLGTDEIALGTIERDKIKIIDKVRLSLDGETIPAIPHFTWHPSGEFAAVTLAGNDRLMFLKYDPTSDKKLSTWGNVLKTAPLPGVGYFTNNGRFFLLTNINLTSDIEEASYADNTSILSIYRFDDTNVPDSPRTRADSGKETYLSEKVKHTKTAHISFGNGYVETFAISPDDSYVVGLNMKASWLPDSYPGKTKESSLTLFGLDKENGKASFLGEFDFDGTLPECISFDRSGKNLVVANFNRNTTGRGKGGLDFWRLMEKPDGPTLIPRKFVQLMRGVHYFIIQ
ncbi:hypothetical protein FGF1_00680 [Flavobacteriaceae bacterium GF1]